MSFLDAETQAKMETALGLDSAGSSPDDVVDGAEDAKVEDAGSDSSDETTAEPEEGGVVAEAEDVKPTVKGWIPLSRLNQEIDRKKAYEAELADLRQFKTDHGNQPQVQPEADNSADEMSQLMKDIWGDNIPETTDSALLSHVQKLQGDLDGMRTERQQREVQRVQDGWAQDVREIEEVFSKEHGIVDPHLGVMIMNDVVASQGKTHPHEAAEKILQFVHGLTKKEAKEVIAEAVDATPASPRGAKGKRSPSSSSKKRKIPSTVAESSKLAAAAMGVDW